MRVRWCWVNLFIFQWKFSTSTFVSVELPAARGCGVDSAANRELPTALGPNPFMN